MGGGGFKCNGLMVAVFMKSVNLEMLAKPLRGRQGSEGRELVGWGIL